MQSKVEIWMKVAEAIGTNDHEYDLGDTSHRLDVVQLVCGAIERAGFTIRITPEVCDSAAMTP